MALLVSGGTLLTEKGPVQADVLVEGPRIRRIGAKLPKKGAKVLPARGGLVAPGLVDLQINGAFGRTFSSSTSDEISDVARRLVEFGVTSFVPTLVSLPLEVLRSAIGRIREAMGRSGGARILGVHLEGPYLNPEKRGAHRAEFVRSPALGEFRVLCDAADGALRMVTVAPELPGALEIVREASERGAVVAAGHTTADAAQVRRAQDAGLTHVTHLFNAMSPFHHRDETVVNAALEDESLTCSLIYDRHHLTASTARMVLRLKRTGSVCLVSDATAALGASDGILELDGARYVVQDGAIRVEGSERLAGSVSSLLDGVRNIREDASLSVGAAVALGASAPAAVLGLSRKGTLRPGADADLVVFDSGLRVRAVVVEGDVLLER